MGASHGLMPLPLSSALNQWRRLRSKGARSFRGQKILQRDYPDALLSSKKDNLLVSLKVKTQAANAVSPSK